MNAPVSVLVTGSSGRIGRAAVVALEARGHRVRGFDLTPTPGLRDCVTGSIGDRAALDRAMGGIESLIHLAATPDDADMLGELMPNNIAGLYHVLEAARTAGVRRLILASSGQMNDTQQWRGPWPVRTTDPVTPRYWYAATKALMESIGYSYSQRHGLSVIIARLGWCPRTAGQVREIAVEERFQDVYLSPADAGRFFACAVEAPASVKFEIVYATSNAVKTERLDPEPARRLLGFEARERWPQGLDVVLGRDPAPGEI